MSIQQMLLGVGAVATKTYVDDVFSNFLYTPPDGDHTVTNGIDLSGEGGLVWIKNRTSARSHTIFDTVRGSTSRLYADRTDAAATNAPTAYCTGFNSNGFGIGNGSDVGTNTDNYSSWSFRKSPMFDVVTWTGNDSSQNISHNLGSEPGCIIVKCTSEAQSWVVWHNKLADPKTYYLHLNTNDDNQSSTSIWNNTAPTSTQFTVGANDYSNKNSATYVAYLFAGGESTAATARSVDFTNDSLTIATNSTDFDFGNGDFTIEFWANNRGGSTGIVGKRTSGGAANTNFLINSQDIGDGKHHNLQVYFSDGSNYILEGTETPHKVPKGTWAHYAVVRNGNTFTLYVNGIASISTTSSGTVSSTSRPLVISPDSFAIGVLQKVKISNLRIVKGTAVYTSSFRPPTEPLTNITNTKLLCCNDSSTTGSTVTPETITTNSGSPTASTDSPFDDPAGFVFGDAGDQNIIKCGSYPGSGSANLEINVGWEPQYLLVKRTDAADNWYLADTMRGMTAEGAQRLIPDLNEAEASRTDDFEMTPTGFNCITSDGQFNASGGKFIYIAIRRPDGYVGKPVELGSDCFSMDTGNSSTTIPTYDSGFPVDFALRKNTTTAADWCAPARLTSGTFVKPNSTAAQLSDSDFIFDSNTGWAKGSGQNSNLQSWMWKRSNSFTTVAYKGDGVAGRQIAHDLGPNNVPEMIWVKARTGTSAQHQNWKVYHKGLNGGTNPEQYFLNLDNTVVENDNTGNWNDTAPTSTHVTVGNAAETNSSGYTYLMMLFASTDVSKVGSYTGNNASGGTNQQYISTGFTPRFILIKRTTVAGDWQVIDSLRGINSGSTTEPALYLNDSSAQDSGYNLIQGTDATGFTLSDSGRVNADGEGFVYYAHA